MYSEDDLASAIEAGVISAETAAAFRAHAAQRNVEAAADDEQFRLVTGFNDIFVVIACVLLLASVKWITATIGMPALGGLAMSVLAWLLAEFFVRKRHMALPAIVLLLAFVFGIFIAVPAVLGQNNMSFGVASAVTAVATLLHWWRFQVPITVAAGTAAVATGMVVALMLTVPGAERLLPLLLFVAGIAVFALAMRWDAADTRRLTRRSDVAFWLHLLAAPLLVHPVFTALGVASGHTQLVQAVAVVALYVFIALVSLAIDRRALMVSALAYVLYTFSALLKEYGVVSLGFAVTALAIGSALLLLSAFWHRSRAFVLRRLPLGMQARLPVSRPTGRG
ncbi:MAG: hypothetical protein JWQ90_1297 [Hydrocarboniphaga sp.]|uniref:hypothetical protein n=1 Tax=Hydrocarboniphaga sp. TaxID=2033016 RepID=UPI00261EC672|nr:hypothetical protein [Hydrocarboniphaga sp.]MDB5968847.1 hypothetical protein [Hydrocarboniphaga sp.]